MRCVRTSYGWRTLGPWRGMLIHPSPVTVCYQPSPQLPSLPRIVMLIKPRFQMCPTGLTGSIERSRDRGPHQDAPCSNLGKGTRRGEPSAEEKVGHHVVLGAPRLSGDSLLGHEAGGREHAQPAVRELLLLHDPELSRVLGLEVQRVKTKVSGNVARAQTLEVGVLLGESRLRLAKLLVLDLDLAVVRVCPALLDAQGFGHADGERHGKPEARWQLWDLLDRRAAVRLEEGVEVLLHQEAC